MFFWYSTYTAQAKFLYIYLLLKFMVPCELYVARDIEIANKSLDILMNHFECFINFPIRSDLAR